MAKWLRRLGYGVIVTAILYLLAYLVVGALASAAVERELAAIRERGEPIALEEMAPTTIPEEENAAPHLVATSDLLVDLTDEEETALDRFLKAPFTAAEEDAGRVRSWVAKNEAAFLPLSAAIARNSCRFDGYYASSPGRDVPEVMPFITAGKLLVARSLLRALDNEGEAAFEDSLATIRIASHVGSDPVLVLVMVRIVIEDVALDGLEELLRKHRPSDAMLARLAAEIERTDTREILKQAMIAERCAGISLFESLQGDGEAEGIFWDSEVIGPPPGFGLIPAPVFRYDEARYLNMMARAIALVEHPWQEARLAWMALEDEYRDPPFYALISQVVSTQFRGIVRRVETHRARLAMARIALAGNRPALIDPFTGRPYEQREAEDGSSELRSPGPDEDDPSDDLVWRLN